MAYTIVTEVNAAAREYLKDGLDRIKAALDANRAVLVGSATVPASEVQIGTWHAVLQFPAIRIGHRRARISRASMGSSGQDERVMEFRVYCYDGVTGDAATTEQDVAQLADRVAYALIANPTLDGWCLDLEVPEIVTGRRPHGNGYVGAASVDVRVLKFVSRP